MFLEGSGDGQCQSHRKRGSAHKAVTMGHTGLEGLLLFCKSLVGSLLLNPFVMLQNMFK